MIDLAKLPMGSLFSGVGGLELGLEWAGIGRTVWQVEIDPWCRGVLGLWWPHVRRYSDVREVGGPRSRRPLERVGIICGGFPCQDISSAGKREGIEGARSGLWREQLRIITELQPLVVVVENVARLAANGLDFVARGLDDAGYDVEARIISAADVGAPHRRERLFVLAYADGERLDQGCVDVERPAESDRELAYAGDDRLSQIGAGHDVDGGDASGEVADRCDQRMADAERERPRHERQRMPGRWARDVRARWQTESLDDGAHRGRHAESRLGGGAHGLPDRVDRWPARPGDPAALWEPSRSMMAYSPVRARRLHGLGNACVPQCLAPVADRIRERLSS